MEINPTRQAQIDAHVAETRALMLQAAFELNDLVRYAISAATGKANKVYYPMDPVNDGIRQWQGLRRKLAKLSADIDRSAARLEIQPFDPEAPAG